MGRESDRDQVGRACNSCCKATMQCGHTEILQPKVHRRGSSDLIERLHILQAELDEVLFSEQSIPDEPNFIRSGTCFAVHSSFQLAVQARQPTIGRCRCGTILEEGSERRQPQTMCSWKYLELDCGHRVSINLEEWDPAEDDSNCEAIETALFPVVQSSTSVCPNCCVASSLDLSSEGLIESRRNTVGTLEEHITAESSLYSNFVSAWSDTSSEGESVYESPDTEYSTTENQIPADLPSFMLTSTDAIQSYRRWPAAKRSFPSRPHTPKSPIMSSISHLDNDDAFVHQPQNPQRYCPELAESHQCVIPRPRLALLEIPVSTPFKSDKFYNLNEKDHFRLNVLQKIVDRATTRVSDRQVQDQTPEPPRSARDLKQKRSRSLVRDSRKRSASV